MKKLLFYSLLFFSIILYSANVYAFEKNAYALNDTLSIQNVKHQYDLQVLASKLYDENGNLIENEMSMYSIAINGSTIAPGQTKYYFPSGHSSGFYMIEDTIMRIRASFSKTASIKIGLTNGDDTLFQGETMDILLICYSTGYHKLFIKNLGNETITVNGTIEY